MTCTDYAAPLASESIGSTRHLLYFVCPLHNGGIWQRNVAALKQRIGLFNGRRIVAIATGNPIRKRGIRPANLDSPDMVINEFGDSGCEFQIVQNDRRLGEVVAWRQLWERVLPGGSDDVTFYGHAKGVTRQIHPTVSRWTEILYETCLDYWPLVQQQLREFPVTGSFKKLGYCFPGVPSTFHYSGTFVWYRNADLASRNWTAPPRQWAGTEALPGIIFKPEEGGELFHSAYGTVLNCYSVDYMTRVIEPEYLKWQEANGHHRTRDAGRISREAVPA